MSGKKQCAEEQDAVNTTIVGGRPPGCGKPVGPIPRGIEVLVKKAAVDPEFRQLLIETRCDAAKEIDLELESAEAMMLKAVPESQLNRIVDSTIVPPEQRSAFMGKVAAAMLVAISATMIASCGPAETKGIAPDRPKQVQPTDGIRPDRPEQDGQKQDEPKSLGIRPDRPDSE